MPKATINSEGTRLDLNTCPGGYVILHQLSFGQLLKRRDMALKYSQEMSPGKIDDVTMVHVDIMNEATRRFDFANCIKEHNLEDDNGNTLNFHNPKSLDILDPRIAAEIEREMDGMNLVDFDDEVFTGPLDQSSTPTSNGSSVGDILPLAESTLTKPISEKPSTG